PSINKRDWQSIELGDHTQPCADFFLASLKTVFKAYSKNSNKGVLQAERPGNLTAWAAPVNRHRRLMKATTC
ncbi:hypothetical protein ACVBEH_04035, partial [Roseateles sp. GG27B]